MKWLAWPDYLRVVQQLRMEAAGLDKDGKARKRLTVAWSIQKVLQSCHPFIAGTAGSTAKQMSCLIAEHMYIALE